MVASSVEFYKTHFADRFYLELIRTGRPDEESYLHFALEPAEQEDLPVVATNEVVFLTEDLLMPMKSVWRFTTASRWLIHVDQKLQPTTVPT